jgi:hypothetical protein
VEVALSFDANRGDGWTRRRLRGRVGVTVTAVDSGVGKSVDADKRVRPHGPVHRAPPEHSLWRTRVEVANTTPAHVEPAPPDASARRVS